jgi:protein-L-isoaspartate O-methyltransferase
MTTGAGTRTVQRQRERRGIHDSKVLAAMRKIERQAFLPEAILEFVYEESALPIEEGSRRLRRLAAGSAAGRSRRG